jgi:hypothetical protein
MLGSILGYQLRLWLTVILVMDSNYESRDEELVKSIQAYEVEAQLKQK